MAEGAVGGSGGVQAGGVDAGVEELSADPLRGPCSQAAPTPDGDRGLSSRGLPTTVRVGLSSQALPSTAAPGKIVSAFILPTTSNENVYQTNKGRS